MNGMNPTLFQQWAKRFIASGGAYWGAISGTLSNQTDLQSALNAKASTTYVDGKVSDSAYGAGWNGETSIAPSKNAVYDKIETLGTSPVVATGAEVNTGTDNAKFVSPLAMEDSDYIKAAYADAKVADAIANGVTTVAPSQNAVFDALALKQDADAQLTSIAALAYAGNANKVVRVNAGETDFEFVAMAGGGDMLGANNLSDVANAGTSRTNLGVGTGDSPQFTGINVGHASDTTVTRSAAGVIAVEGVDVPLNAITATHVAQQIELGHASDTTITRSGAGAIQVEGVQVLLSGAALGTPASGTLTNCTGLPLAGVTDSTSEALGVGSLELGHATDTTISRTAAGMAAVEGKGIITRIITTVLTSGTAATHNFTSGMVYAEVWCTGGGAGGGGARASDGTSQASASGGGGGGTAYRVYDATEAGASALYTVGGVAAGGVNTGGNGTNGNSSTFDPAGTGVTLTGAGGAQGIGHDNATPAAAFKDGGAGGNGTNGSANFTGNDGNIGWTSTAAMTVITSGFGGASYWGGGAAGQGATTTVAKGGRAGQTYGSGGSGACALNATAGATGGQGAAGVIIIKEFCQ